MDDVAFNIVFRISNEISESDKQQCEAQCRMSDAFG